MIWEKRWYIAFKDLEKQEKEYYSDLDGYLSYYEEVELEKQKLKVTPTPTKYWERRGKILRRGDSSIELEPRFVSILDELCKEENIGNLVTWERLMEVSKLRGREGVRDAVIDLKNLLVTELNLDRGELDRIIEPRKRDNTIIGYICHCQ